MLPRLLRILTFSSPRFLFVLFACLTQLWVIQCLHLIFLTALVILLQENVLLAICLLEKGIAGTIFHFLTKNILLEIYLHFYKYVFLVTFSYYEYVLLQLRKRNLFLHFYSILTPNGAGVYFIVIPGNFNSTLI